MTFNFSSCLCLSSAETVGLWHDPWLHVGQTQLGATLSRPLNQGAQFCWLSSNLPPAQRLAGGENQSGPRSWEEAELVVIELV